MEKIIFKKIENSTKYQSFLMENFASFTQSDFYGDWHKKQNREVLYYSIEKSNGEVLLFMQAIELKSSFKQKFLYSPYGPVVKKEYLSQILPILKKGLLKEIKKRKDIFFRLDFFPTLNSEEEKLLKKYFTLANKKTYKGSIFQPRDEWVLDITDNEEGILNKIDKKNRYCIRQAEKRGVLIEIIDKNIKEHFNTFYNLLKITAHRNNFNIHNENYYREVFETIEKNKNGYLVNSIVDGEISDSLLFINFGNTTMFIFGGSDDTHRSIPSAHLAQWKSILYAKSLNMKYYNFGGISTTKNFLPGLDSVTRFKKRFGGFIFEHSVFFDLVNNKFFYFLYVIKKILNKL